MGEGELFAREELGLVNLAWLDELFRDICAVSLCRFRIDAGEICLERVDLWKANRSRSAGVRLCIRHWGGDGGMSWSKDEGCKVGDYIWRGIGNPGVTSRAASNHSQCPRVGGSADKIAQLNGRVRLNWAVISKPAVWAMFRR